MRFVDPKNRKKLDAVCDHIFLTDIKFDGDFNYILYRLAKHYLKHGYGNLKNMLAELHEAEQYIRYRILYPYEEKKEQENGDVNRGTVKGIPKIGE